MASKLNQKSAIAKINKCGALLVYPLRNQPEPNSLWREFFANKKMRWEWDASHDNGVADMWMLMKRLSGNTDVVYSKWYQGRATFFSREVFCAMLTLVQGTNPHQLRQPPTLPASQLLLEILESDSPLSTRDLKKLAELQGKDNESMFQRALKELFSKLLIVGFGEVDDGAFPSLAVGSTRLLYEDLCNQAYENKLIQAQRIIDRSMPIESHFRRALTKLL